MVGRAGGRGREGLARGHDRAVPQEASECHDQDGSRNDERSRAGVQGGGRGEEGPGPAVLLGRHLVARRRVGRLDEAGVGLHPRVRAEALHQHRRGHVQRQGVDGRLVRAAVVPGSLSEGRPREGGCRCATHVDAVALGVRQAERQGHHLGLVPGRLRADGRGRSRTRRLRPAPRGPCRRRCGRKRW